MKIQKAPLILLSLLAFTGLLLLVDCQTSVEGGRAFDLVIDKDNDSLLTFDTLIVTVYSKDSSYSEIVFHGKLTDAKQVLGLPLNNRIGTQYQVSVIGYKNNKVGVNKELIVLGINDYKSKDLPIQAGVPKDTSKIEPTTPEILVASDTAIAEGDSLRLRITIHNPWIAGATLTAKNAPQGSTLDTLGVGSGTGFFSWRPNFSQGRTEVYAVTFVYASSDRKIEKTVSVKVLNTNQPPKIKAIPDQKAKENETLTFKIEASDPDPDSITLTTSALPAGASFASGSFTWKPSLGQSGNYSITFKASDGHDSDLVAVLITVGNVDVPPALAVKITSPARDTTLNFTPLTVLYTVNGILLQRKVALRDGKNKIFIDTTVAGRTAFDTLTVILDTVPPGKPFVNGPSPVRTRTPSWTWTSGGNGNGAFRYRVDTEDMTSATIVTDTVFTSSKDLDPGIHTLFVQERDEAGNWSITGKSSVRIDTARPAPPTVTVEPSPTKNTQPTWSWLGVGDDVTGFYRYKLDNANLLTGAVETRDASYMPKTGEELREGLHTLYVQQQDSAGNWSNSGNALIRVDLTPPDAPQIKMMQTSPINIPKPVWSWTSGGNGGAGTYRLKLDDSTLTNGATTVTSLNYTPDTALIEGPHTLYVQERDTAGNWSKRASQSIRIDLTSPNAPSISTAELKTTKLKPTWTWHSGRNGGSGVYRYKLDDTAMVGRVNAPDTLYTPASPLGEGIHTLFVQEKDSAGNWSSFASLALRIYGQTGYAAGRSGKIIKTTNAGESWKILISGTVKNLNSIYFTDANMGYVAGANGTLIKTSNGGEKWDSLNSGTSDWLNCVHFTDANTGYAGGDNGTIIKTTNAGATWRLRNSDTSYSINSIFFTDARTGYAAAGGTGILKTTNAGDTWAPLSSTGGYDPQSVYFTDANTGYAAGGSGTIIKTTNGGEKWEIIHTSLDGLSSIYFSDSNNGYAVGTGGSVVKTTNSGSSWKTVPSPTVTHMYSVYFTDVNTGYAVGDNGTIIGTTDAGENWMSLPGDAEKAVFFP